MACISINKEILTLTCGPKTHIVDLESCEYKSIDHSEIKIHKSNSESDRSQSADARDEQGIGLLASEISDCGEKLAFCTTSKMLAVVNLKDPNFSVILTHHLVRGASKIRFTPVTKNIVVADKSGDVYLYTITNKNGTSDSRKLILGHLSFLLDVLVTQDEQFIITCDRDEKIRVSSFPNGFNIICYCLGHTEFVSSIRFLPNNSDTLVSTSGDGTIRFWNFKNGKELVVCNTFQHLLNHDSDNQKDEDIAAITDSSVMLIDEVSSIICVSIDFFNTCLVFNCSSKENEITCDLVHRLSFEDFTPWKVDICDKNLLVVLNSKDTVCLKTYTFNPETSVFEESNNDLVAKAANRLNSVKPCIDPRKNVVNILFKRKFDNVQDYLERKEARIAQQEINNKKLKPC